MEYLQQLKAISDYFQKHQKLENEHIETLLKIKDYLFQHEGPIDYSCNPELAELYQNFLSFRLNYQFTTLFQKLNNKEDTKSIIAFVKACIEENKNLTGLLPFEFKSTQEENICLVAHMRALGIFNNFLLPLSNSAALEPKNFKNIVYNLLSSLMTKGQMSINQGDSKEVAAIFQKTVEALRLIVEQNTEDYLKNYAGFIEQYIRVQHELFKAGYDVYAYRNNPKEHELFLFQLEYLWPIGNFKLLLITDEVNAQNIADYKYTLEKLIQFIQSGQFLNNQYDTENFRKTIIDSLEIVFSNNYHMALIELAKDPKNNQAQYYIDQTQLLYNYLEQRSSNTNSKAYQLRNWFLKFYQNSQASVFDNSYKFFTFMIDKINEVKNTYTKECEDPIVPILQKKIDICFQLAYQIIDYSTLSKELQNPFTLNTLLKKFASEFLSLSIVTHHVNINAVDETFDRMLIETKASILQNLYSIIEVRHVSKDPQIDPETIGHVSQLYEDVTYEYNNLILNEHTKTICGNVILACLNLTLFLEIIKKDEAAKLILGSELENLVSTAEKLFLGVLLSENDDLLFDKLYYETLPCIYYYFRVQRPEFSATITPVIRVIETFRAEEEINNYDQNLQIVIQTLAESIKAYCEKSENELTHSEEHTFLKSMKKYVDKQKISNYHLLAKRGLDSQYQAMADLLQERAQKRIQKRDPAQSAKSDSAYQRLIEILEMAHPESPDSSKNSSSDDSDTSNDNSPKNSLSTGQTDKTLKTDLEELVKKQSYQQATDSEEYNKNILSLMQNIKKLSKTYGLNKAQEKKLLKYLSQPGKQLDIDHLIKKLIFSKKFKKPYEFTSLPFKYDQPNGKAYSQDHIFDVTDPIEDNIIGLPPALEDTSDDFIIIGDPEREDSQPKEIIIGDAEDQHALNPFIVKEPGFIYKPYEQKSLNEIIKSASKQKGIQYQILPIQGFKAQNILQSAKAEGRVIQFLMPIQQASASTGTDGPVNSEFARIAHTQAGGSATRGAILQGPGSRGFQPPRNPAFTFTVPSVSSLASGYITIFMVIPRAHTDISVITSDSTTSTDKSMAFLDLGYMVGTMWIFTKYVATKYPNTAAVIMVGTAGKHMWDSTQPLLKELEKGQRGMTVYHVNEKDYLKSGVSCTDGRRHVFLKHLDPEKKAPIFFRK